MFNYLHKTFLHGRRAIAASSTHKLLFLPNTSSSMSLRFILSTANHQSFAVSYLINSCGLSPESALSASKHVRFNTPEKPDSVVAFLKTYGFSETQISVVIKKYPLLLVSDPEKTLLLKFQFCESKGFSRLQLAKLICTHPHILHSSLEARWIPCFEILNNVLKSDEKTIFAVIRYPWALIHDTKTYLIPNINLLRETGVPESKIAYLLYYQPRKFFTNPDQFRQIVEDVKRMGFRPLVFSFIEALHVFKSISKMTWKEKTNVFKRWGWSEEDILMAFRKRPIFMLLSEDKIMGNMDYFVNVVGLASHFISKHPKLLSFSMKKRILPRGSVAQVLLSKGLVTESGVCTLFACKEKLFLERFVNRYQEHVPQLLTLYTEKS